MDSEVPYTESFDPEYGIPLPPIDENPELTEALDDFHAALDELRALDN